ncbi:unnamed protein product [Arabidopsis lyrata]|nr:unnamed protein product [Arabidopsis lyrata]
MRTETVNNHNEPHQGEEGTENLEVYRSTPTKQNFILARKQTQCESMVETRRPGSERRARVGLNLTKMASHQRDQNRRKRRHHRIPSREKKTTTTKDTDGLATLL